MKCYVIGLSEMDATEFDASSYAEAMDQAKRTYGEYASLIVFAICDTVDVMI